MNRAANRCAVLLVAVGVLLGVASAAAAKHPATEPIWSAERMPKMVDAYHKALPGKIRVLSIKIYPHRVELQAQDPANLENVDEYKYHGKMDSPIPVRLAGKGSLEANLFDFDAVAYDRIPDLVDGAVAKLGLADGEVGYVLVRRNLPFSKDVQITVYVNGTRKGGMVKADAQGNVFEAKTH